MPRRTMTALFAALMLFCAVFITGRVFEKRYDEGPAELRDAPYLSEPAETEPVEEPVELPDPPVEPEEPREPPAEVIAEADRIREALAYYESMNPDVVGWINVPNTVIDYPIVLGTDNDFYLDHSPLKYYYPLGSIFEDYEDQRAVLDNYNTVLYGHNPYSGWMFHDVEKFLVESFFRSAVIYIYTRDEVYIFEPFTIFEASWEYQYFKIAFKNGEKFVDFAREMRDNSMFPTDIDFTPEDHILTLSTCTNGPLTQRWSLQSRLVDVVDLSRWIAPHETPDLHPERETERDPFENVFLWE